MPKCYRGTLAACALITTLLAAILGIYPFSTNSAEAHYFAPKWDRFGQHQLRLRYNRANTQFGGPVYQGVEGLGSWRNVSQTIFFDETAYDSSNFDFLDSYNLDPDVLGITYLTSTAGYQQLCSAGSITYVEVYLNAPTLAGGNNTRRLNTVIHEAGHGLGLAHTDDGPICGVDYGYIGWPGTLAGYLPVMYGAYLEGVSNANIKPHDIDDINALYP